MTVRVEVEGLVKHFPIRGVKGVVQAVNGVSFSIAPGTTLGVVGESGSGKSTLGRCLLRLLEPTAGSIRFDGEDLTTLGRRALRRRRASLQMIFQDPYESLNPRMRVRRLVEEPLVLHTDMDADSRQQRARELMELVHLEPHHLDRFPGELSGGQLQRVGIARAIALNPDFIVLDEPTSSLDLTVRAGVLKLLRTLQDELNLTYLLISHDLATIGAYCDEVAVMYLGAIVEHGPAEQIFERPQHPYTQALLSAALPADPTVRLQRRVLTGEIPSPVNLPTGCLFASRCPLVRDDCLPRHPDHRDAGQGQRVACVRVDDGSNLLPASAPTSEHTPDVGPVPVNQEHP
jgi:oligopeptide/dipeptide ABC transporter ATP-binding protein